MSQRPTPTTSAAIFSLDHARREKQVLFEREADHERRRYDAGRILETLTWSELAAILLDMGVALLAVLGMAAIVGLLIQRIATGGLL